MTVSPNPANRASQDKAIVKDYFNAAGFDRWRRIYGDDKVSKVQRDIREGHQVTVDTVLYWLGQDLSGLTICDAGCGVGSLSIPLARAGAEVNASDISDNMIGEARIRAEAEGLTDNPSFSVADLETLEGTYDIVTCLDVLIHYPDGDIEPMIARLASLARSRFILSFAPKNPYYTLMKKVGELFPGPSKTTRAYLHREAEVKAILERCGWTVARTEFTATQFYFSRLFEAVKAS